MTDLFWNIFKVSGNLDAFMAYKEFSELKNNIENTGNTDVGYMPEKKDTAMR